MDESNQSTKRSSDFSSATSQSSPRTSTNNFNVSFSSSVDYAYKHVSNRGIGRDSSTQLNNGQYASTHFDYTITLVIFGIVILKGVSESEINKICHVLMGLQVETYTDIPVHPVLKPPAII